MMQTPTSSLTPGMRRLGGPGVVILLLVSVLVLLTAAGCATTQQTERPAVDLQTAKSTTMANERDMVAVIAPEDIVGTQQNKVSNLLGCSDGGHSWTGQITVTLVPGADGDGYVRAIKDAWTGRDGWTVSQRTTAENEPVVDITNAAGYSHGLDFSKKHNAVRVMSFSPCFTLDPPYEYGNEY